MSGSGKSTLVRDVLLRQPARAGRARGAARRPRRRCAAARAIAGWERVGRVLEVDQTPIGKTPRSCPATYVGFWDDIRRLFAGTPEARMRGYGAEPVLVQRRRRPLRGVRGPGREEDRDELPARRDGGLRGVRRRAVHRRDAGGRSEDRSIADVLAMSVDEAAEFFAATARIHHALRLLQDVGPRLPHARPAEPDA